MQNFEMREAPQPGFNRKAKEDGLVPALESFELLAGKEGARIQIKNPIFQGKYSPEEIQADVAESDAFFKKYFHESSGEFRPSMLAEELVKVGESFELFGSKAEIMQASQYDDYKNNADFIVKIQNEMRNKKDEGMLRASERFVLDVTTDKGERFEEKLHKLSAELRNGKLTEVKYFPGTGGSLREIPRFVLQVDEEELLSFFKKAKSSLDRTGGVNAERFASQYEGFSKAASEKILSGSRTQVGYVVECARSTGLPGDIATRLVTLLSSPLGGFYQTLEYVDGLSDAMLNIKDEDKKIMTTRYVAMIKKMLGVGVAIERVLEEKEKRASTQQLSEALH